MPRIALIIPPFPLPGLLTGHTWAQHTGSNPYKWSSGPQEQLIASPRGVIPPGLHRQGRRTAWTATCLFTRLESLAWCQWGFWQLGFCRKCNLWRLCFDGREKGGVYFIAFLEERKCVEKLWRMKNELVSTCSFLHTSNAEILHLSSLIKTIAS